MMDFINWDEPLNLSLNDLDKSIGDIVNIGDSLYYVFEIMDIRCYNEDQDIIYRLYRIDKERYDRDKKINDLLDE